MESQTLRVVTNTATGSGVPPDIETMFREYHQMVYRTAYRVTGNGTDAEDVLQTVFMRLLKRQESAAMARSPMAYLHRAAVNAALDIVRVRPRHTDLEETERVRPAFEPGPDRQHASSELAMHLRRAILELSPRSAEVFVLRHVEGYDNREIARMLGTSAGAVAVSLFKATARLRKSMRSFRGDHQ